MQPVVDVPELGNEATDHVVLLVQRPVANNVSILINTLDEVSTRYEFESNAPNSRLQVFLQ